MFRFFTSSRIWADTETSFLRAMTQSDGVFVSWPHRWRAAARKQNNPEQCCSIKSDLNLWEEDVCGWERLLRAACVHKSSAWFTAEHLQTRGCSPVQTSRLHSHLTDTRTTVTVSLSRLLRVTAMWSWRLLRFTDTWSEQQEVRRGATTSTHLHVEDFIFIIIIYYYCVCVLPAVCCARPAVGRTPPSDSPPVSSWHEHHCQTSAAL